MPDGLLPEEELCLLLARAEHTPEARDRIFELRHLPLHWEKLWKLAEEHQVLPLIFRSFKGLGYQGVPSDFKEKLTAAFRLNAIRNMLFAEELKRIVRVLGEASIHVMPLKGTNLASELYGDPAFRACSDIDIMVQPADAIRARQILIEDGYRSPFSDQFFSKFQFRTSADCPLSIDRGDLSYFLELHWSVLQHSSKNNEATQDIWATAQPFDQDGTNIFRMTPEWEFLYLACHASSHKWQTLKWIADLNDFCAIKSLNWGLVSQKAAQFNLTFVIESTLAVCSQLYGLPIPPEFSTARLPEGVTLFPNSLTPEVAWNAPLYNPKLLKDPSEKFFWFMEMIFVARQADQMAFHLPDSLDFLYFVLRPIRLTFKYAGLASMALAGKFRRGDQ